MGVLTVEYDSLAKDFKLFKNCFDPSGTAKNPETTIAQAKADNQASMRANAAARNQQFQQLYKHNKHTFGSIMQSTSQSSNQPRTQPINQTRGASTN